MLFNQLPVHIFEATSGCCLEEMRVNSVRSAFPELHPLSGLEILKGRQKLIEDLVSASSGKNASLPPPSGRAPFLSVPGVKTPG